MTNPNNVAGVPGLDPTLPDVKLILAGKTYQLVFDFNAIAQAEIATGINLLQASIDTASAQSLRGLLWASLLKQNPTISIEHVGSLITMKNAPTIWAAIREAWFGSVAIDSEDTPQPGEPQAETASD